MAKEEVAKQAAAEAFSEPPQKKSRTKLLLFVVAPLLLLLIAGGGGAYFFFFAKKEEVHVEEKAPPPRPSVFYNLPEILVNLNPAGRRAGFLKMTVSLEVESAADVARLQQVMPRIVDSMQGYLRELRSEDIIGTAGLTRMRQELLLRVNAAANPAKVNDVLFLEVLLQ